MAHTLSLLWVLALTPASADAQTLERHADGRVLLRLDTELGIGYQLEHTTDLLMWNAVDGYAYGLGAEIEWHVASVDPLQSHPGSPAVPPTTPPERVDLQVTVFAPAECLASFIGSDGAAYAAVLPLSFEGKAPVGINSASVGPDSWQYFWFQLGGPPNPEYQNHPISNLPVPEQQKIQAFVDAFATAAATTATTATAPPGGPRHFWRITEDRELDSDGDGIYDAVELAFAAQGLAYSAFSQDSDFDGVADGNADPDGDFVTTAQELAAGTDPHDAEDRPPSTITLQVRSRQITEFQEEDEEESNDDYYYIGVLTQNTSGLPREVHYKREVQRYEPEGGMPVEYFLEEDDEFFDADRVIGLMDANDFSDPESGWQDMDEPPAYEYYNDEAWFEGDPVFTKAVWREYRIVADYPPVEPLVEHFLATTTTGSPPVNPTVFTQGANLQILPASTQSTAVIALAPVAQNTTSQVSALAKPDLDVDSDRNGYIDAADDADEHRFTNTRGAVYFVNYDHDEGRPDVSGPPVVRLPEDALKWFAEWDYNGPAPNGAQLKTNTLKRELQPLRVIRWSSGFSLPFTRTPICRNLP